MLGDRGWWEFGLFTKATFPVHSEQSSAHNPSRRVDGLISLSLPPSVTLVTDLCKEVA